MLVATLSVGQGAALRVTVPDEPGLVAVDARWRGHTVPLAKDGEWFTILGADLDDPAGEAPLDLYFSYADGVRETRVITVAVQPREFPTTRLEVEPKYVELSEADQARTAREREEIGAVYSEVSPEPLWTAPFTVPITGSTGGRNFGHRRVFNEQPRAPHSGADLSASTGTPVRAANRGRVVLAKELFFSGNAVFVNHGLGVYTVYLHLSQIDVATGQLVERGEIVGLAGATGRVTGPHLHWGVRVQGARVDPFSLLDATAADPARQQSGETDESLQ